MDFVIGSRPRIANEVFNPFLAFVWGEVEAWREVASRDKWVSLYLPIALRREDNKRDVDPLMYATVRLADEVPSVVRKIFPDLAQEKVIPDDALGELKLPKSNST